jgi:hypothetical protein
MLVYLIFEPTVCLTAFVQVWDKCTSRDSNLRTEKMHLPGTRLPGSTPNGTSSTAGDGAKMNGRNTVRTR